MATSSAPLADYFWIAGIDSLSYNDPVPWSHNSALKTSQPVNNPPSPSFDATIEEGESEGDTPVTSPTGTENRTPRAQARHSRQNSWNRLSKLTNDSRNSIGAYEEENSTRSNRSSITIKGVPASNGTNGTNGNSNGASGGLLGDFDFDSALLKFAHEREHFLDDISFAAGAPQRPTAFPTARSPAVKIAELPNAQSTKRNQLKSVGGSIRRRISFRDMNSLKRQPTTTQAKRTCEFNFQFLLHIVYCIHV